MAGAKFELVFNQSQVQAAIQAMAATPAEITKASDRAARHTLNAMKTLIARSISVQLNIPVNKLKTRLSIKRYSASSPVWILWVGLNAMPVDQIGPVSQNPTGLSHRNGIVKGGFHQALFGQGRHGWIRKKRARELGLNLPGLEKWKHNVTFHGELKHKFPVVRISTDLGKAAETIINHWQSKARGRFLTRFEHELANIKRKK
ncbi:hypothetical protein AhyVDH1_018 [Aeromonas phage AhyVDH1]|nr:hypothetical protein AhyVDH1_018 [Aeromonas phage AhyVDH1]